MKLNEKQRNAIIWLVGLVVLICGIFIVRYICYGGKPSVIVKRETEEAIDIQVRQQTKYHPKSVQQLNITRVNKITKYRGVFPFIVRDVETLMVDSAWVPVVIK